VVDVIIKPKVSLFIKLHESGTGNGFGDGSNDVNGVRGCWYVCFKVSITIGVLPKYRGIVDNAGGHARVMTDMEKDGNKRIK
jgi:hypothetical protein